MTYLTEGPNALDAAPPDLNGNLEENVRALIWTIFGDARNPGTGLVAQVAEMRRTLNRIYAAVIGILATGLVALIVNVVVLVGK